MNTTMLSVNAIKNFNNLGFKAQECFKQIIAEKVVPKELLEQLLEEYKTENLEKNLRAVVSLMNNPRVVNYSQNEEKRVHIVNSKEKKCQILAVLFWNSKNNVQDSIKYFADLISDDDLIELKCIITSDVDCVEKTRETIHSIMNGLNPEMFDKLEDPLVCIAQQAYKM